MADYEFLVFLFLLFLILPLLEIGHTAVYSSQTENEEPQPQVVVALGLRITNCEPSSPSV